MYAQAYCTFGEQVSYVESETPPPVTPSDNLKRLKLPTAIYNKLAREGILTVNELMNTPTDRLLYIRNLRWTAIDLIDQTLEANGLRRGPFVTIDFLGLPTEITQRFRPCEATTIIFLKWLLNDGATFGLAEDDMPLIEQALIEYDRNLSAE